MWALDDLGKLTHKINCNQYGTKNRTKNTQICSHCRTALIEVWRGHAVPGICGFSGRAKGMTCTWGNQPIVRAKPHFLNN